MPNHHSSLLWTLPFFLSISILSATPHFQEEESTPITRFQQYLRINTAHPNPKYSSAISFLQSQSHSLNLQTQILYFAPTKPLLLLTWTGSNPSLPSILLNSHLDSVPAEPSKWAYHPFSAFRSPSDGKIFARGAQDDKCIGLQYLEAIRILKNDFNFEPSRTVHISYVPDEEIGGFDGMAAFVKSILFGELDLGFMLDEGQASVNEHYRVFYADRSPWHMVIKAVGMPGHGSRMYDDSAMENLMKSIEVMSKFRENQFDLVKAGWADHSDVVSVNPVYLKAGIASPAGFVMNMQPSEAEAGFDIRFSPTTDSDVLKKRIADEWAPAARNMTFEDVPDPPRVSVDKRPSWRDRLDMSRGTVICLACGCCCFHSTITHDKGWITEKGPLRDYLGCPLMTQTNDSNPWWSVFKQAIEAAGGKLSKPEILSSTTDARFIRQLGIPALGFSPMKNTPILLHDHNEFLKDTVYLEGIKIYVSIIRSLSSFEGASSL